jgi:hypothetical protein
MSLAVVKSDGLLEGWRHLLHNSIVAEKHPKRPRDLNQWAKRMVDIATGAASDHEPTPEEQDKDPAAVSLGRRGGLKGGPARSAKMTGEQRAEAARTAAKARWSKS